MGGLVSLTIDAEEPVVLVTDRVVEFSGDADRAVYGGTEPAGEIPESVTISREVVRYGVARAEAAARRLLWTLPVVSATSTLAAVSVLATTPLWLPALLTLLAIACFTVAAAAALYAPIWAAGALWQRVTQSWAGRAARRASRSRTGGPSGSTAPPANMLEAVEAVFEELAEAAEARATDAFAMASQLPPMATTVMAAPVGVVPAVPPADPAEAIAAAFVQAAKAADERAAKAFEVVSKTSWPAKKNNQSGQAPQPL